MLQADAKAAPSVDNGSVDSFSSSSRIFQVTGSHRLLAHSKAVGGNGLLEEFFIKRQPEAGCVRHEYLPLVHLVGRSVKPRRGDLVPLDEEKAIDGRGHMA